MGDLKFNKEHCCCFFGHRKITETEALKTRLYDVIENLIANEDINTFLFGSKSQFDDLCLEIVTDLKEKILSHKKNICESRVP